MSNQMNPWLASIYGTDGADDLEKTAQAHMLNKLAAESNLDISQLSPEEMQQMLQELAAEGYDVGAVMQAAQQQQPQAPQMGGGMGMGGMPQMPQGQAFAPAAQQQQPQMPQGMNPSMMQQQPQQQNAAAEMQKEAQAKFEEADLLGRVMAHAYTDELEKIASHRKTASAMKVRGIGDKLRSAAHHAHGFAKKHPGASHAAAGAAGFAGGAAAGRKMKHKEASAFEKMAEEHAAEILSATGYDPSTGQDMYGQQMLQDSMQQQGQGQQQPQAAPQQGNFQQQQPQQAVNNEQQFSQALDQRALELLAENGYDVNEVLARIQMAQNQQPAQA